jgi:aklavinone 12-hydroxylase
MPIVDEAAVELGYRYRSPGIDVEAGDDALWEDPRSPSGRPGFRAPHATVVANGAECSTLDLFGRDFVVVAGSAGEAWCDAARAAGEVLGVGVDTYRVGAEIAGAELEELFGTGADGASLVRPDGFVAWRTPAPADDTDDVLTRAIGAALGRSRVSV